MNEAHKIREDKESDEECASSHKLFYSHHRL